MKGKSAKQAFGFSLPAFFRIFIALLFTVIPSHAQAPPPPVNDYWDDRIALQGTNFDFTGSTYGATFELGDPTRTVEMWDPVRGTYEDPNAGSIWWSWTSPISGRAVLSLPPIPNFIEGVHPKLVVFTDSPVDLNTGVATTLDVVPGYYANFPINAGETYGLALIASARTNVAYTIHFEASTTPVILQQPQSQTVTAGGACFFTVVAPGYDTNKNVQWTHNGVAIPGFNGPSLLVQNASAESAGEYRAYVNILSPNAATVSEPATLTVEGADIEPQMTVQNVAGATNEFALQVYAETNEFYLVYYSTNFTFGSQLFVPDVYDLWTHAPIPYFANGGLIRFEPDVDVSVSFFRAERGGDQKQTCIANLRRLEFAKETWKINNHVYAGWASGDTSVNNFMDGVRATCPLGGFITYNSLGTPATCSIPEHRQ